MNTEQRTRLQKDFEVYMKVQVRMPEGLSLPHFVDFAASLCNFYIGSKLLAAEDKEHAAQLLCMLFNRGLKQPIGEKDVQTIVSLIVEDNTLDYTLLAPIF